jgi:thioester reductase-like protein
VARLRTVLMTGASGVVGRAIARELTDCHIVGLVHSDMDMPEIDRVIASDLAQERLGLSAGTWRELVDSVDCVIHSAALTQWGQPWERYQAINIEGTRRVIDFALASEAPVQMVSTCFVHAIERGQLDSLAPDNVVRPYIMSKLESERLLAQSGIAHSVFRPTNLVGESSTGWSSRPQIVQAMSEWIARGKAPYLPAHPGNLLDVVPTDVLARAVVEAVRQEDTGGLYWVTYGDQAMSPDESLDVLLDQVASLGREIQRPPIVDPRHPLPIPLEQIPPMSRTFLKVLIDVSEVTRGCGGVLPTSMVELGERFGVQFPSDRDAYRKSLDYWAEQRRAVTAEGR